MSIYSSIYDKLCQDRKSLSEQYGKGSGLHKHHIVPKHSGGTDDPENFTYLTVREHIIAHFLLWKIHSNINDLRSMNMLGAKLTSKQRRLIGEWCRDNGIGFHNSQYDSQRNTWRARGIQTQKESGSKETFYFWSTKEGRKERAALGGKASFESGNNKDFLYWASEEGRAKRASMGGQAHKGKRCMYKPGDTSFKRVKAEDIPDYLSNGYVFGSPIKAWNKKD